MLYLFLCGSVYASDTGVEFTDVLWCMSIILCNGVPNGFSACSFPAPLS